MEIVLLYVAIVGYMAAGAGYLGYLTRHDRSWHRFGHRAFVAATCVHLVVLVLAMQRLGHFPTHTLRSTLSFASWSIAVVFLVFQWRFRLMVLGSVAAPLVAVCMLVVAGLPEGGTGQEALLSGFWVFIHITAIFLGDGAFVLAAAVGAIYLLQERAIKRKKHGFIFRRLPSLDSLDRMGYALVAFGFPMLTAGIATGCVYAQIVWGRFWSWDPKEVWSLVTWLVYAALLHERLAVGWRGRKTAIMAIIGLVVLLFTFFGVNFFMEGHHGRFTKI
ncbi:MAG: c-type cytochrome biogenesis protein CcsB [Desulfatibacillaceae bacterium]